jgi:hypothetical protein
MNCTCFHLTLIVARKFIFEIPTLKDREIHENYITMGDDGLLLRG